MRNYQDTYDNFVLELTAFKTADNTAEAVQRFVLASGAVLRQGSGLSGTDLSRAIATVYGPFSE